MGSAQRHREFVAHLAPHRPELGEAQVVGVGGAPPANQTRLRCHEFEMILVALPTRLADREFAFVDFGGRGVGLNMRQSRWVVVDGRLRRRRGRGRWYGGGYGLSAGAPSPPVRDG